jgi:hypothetical protein
MQNEMSLDSLNLVELNNEEANSTNGGFTIFKFTWTGFMDGDRSNDEIHLNLLGFDIF